MPSGINEQIERRRQRARDEITKVINKGNHPLFSLFEVTSISGRTYRVEIHALDEFENTCTCPDYRTNLISTCKHIEGVLLYLNAEHGERIQSLAQERPRGTQIYLHYGVDVTVRLALPIPDRPALLWKRLWPSIMAPAPRIAPDGSEGYQALTAFLPGAAAPQEEVYRALALPTPAGPESLGVRRKKAQEGLAFAERCPSRGDVATGASGPGMGALFPAGTLPRL